MNALLPPDLLRTFFWTSVIISTACITGISIGLNFAEGVQRQRGLYLIWICSGVLAATATVVIAVLLH